MGSNGEVLNFLKEVVDEFTRKWRDNSKLLIRVQKQGNSYISGEISWQNLQRTKLETCRN